jgi:hypothetical protein
MQWNTSILCRSVMRKWSLYPNFRLHHQRVMCRECDCPLTLALSALRQASKLIRLVMFCFLLTRLLHKPTGNLPPPPSYKRRGIRRVGKCQVCCTFSEGRIHFIVTKQRTAVMTVAKTSVDLSSSWPYSRHDLLHCGYVNIFRSVLHLLGHVPFS